ncbi:hypothetical protein ACFE04_016860 [Oxalis oulophora]
MMTFLSTSRQLPSLMRPLELIASRFDDLPIPLRTASVSGQRIRNSLKEWPKNQKNSIWRCGESNPVPLAWPKNQKLSLKEWPKNQKHMEMEMRGIEPRASRMRSERSTI